ncbi:MAG: hypothetical protein HZA89_07450 [Verrucomicrobia bacterium]|nr:hypothetical protein [Verrucomicrobiota bacterium]
MPIHANYSCLYVDNSNIYIEGQRVAEKFVRETRTDFRIYFPNLIKLLTGKRPVKEVVWGGSTPPESDDVWGFLRGTLHIEPDLLKRAGGENETVDHLVQLRMHRHVRKYRHAPGTIVLATGDGKGYHREEGFLYDIEGFVADGWQLEVASWEHACHKKLREFAEKHGKFISLDQHYYEVSFIRNGRIVQPLNA